MGSERVIEVFADVGCPFTHVGLRRFVQHREAVGRGDVTLWVRAWPLEVVNGTPMDAHFISEEVDEIRDQVGPELFTGFRESTFPATSLPAMALAAAAYETGVGVGERVSLALRDLIFERGEDVTDPEVLRSVGQEYGVPPESVDPERVLDDHAEGVRRGVIGSPHFFTPTGGFFCPALDVSRDDEGRLHIAADTEGFDGFITSCFA